MTNDIARPAVLQTALAVYKFHEHAERMKPRPKWLDDPRSRELYEVACLALRKAL